MALEGYLRALAYQAGQFHVAGDVEALMEADAWFVRPVAH